MEQWSLITVSKETTYKKAAYSVLQRGPASSNFETPNTAGV